MSAAIAQGSLPKRTLSDCSPPPRLTKPNKKALQTLLTDYVQQHKDNLKDVDNLLALDRIGKHTIRLTPNPHGKPAEIGFQGYLPI